WLLATPQQRRWLLTPWPYLGGLAAAALVLPGILWNADHQWVSVLKLLTGRAHFEDFRPACIAEVIPPHFVFATPFLFILGTMGLYALIHYKTGALSTRVLISSMFWTIALYFVWHSLHARVEANWFAPVYPPFVIAAAVAAHLVPWERRAQALS